MAKAVRQLSVIGRPASMAFFLQLLHFHGELRDTGAAVPVDEEFANEGDKVDYFEAPNIFGEMGEEIEW